MRAINHTVTGAVVGAAIGNPWLALPAALLSHFVLDIIPHSGDTDGTSLYFKLELAVDAALGAAFLLTIAILQPEQWLLLIACGVLGAAPDLWWLPYWIWELKEGKPRKLDKLGKLMGDIQWSQTKPGYIVEAIWLPIMLYTFFRLTV
jgi:hypothetical protein